MAATSWSLDLRRQSDSYTSWGGLTGIRPEQRIGCAVARQNSGRAKVSVRASAETLGQVPIFADCDPVHLQVLAFSSERRQFESGDHLMIRGQVGAAAYLILSGEADVFGEGTAPTGRAGQGAFLGEVAMIAELPYSLTAIARGPLIAARIDRQLFMRVAAEYPEFGTAVFGSLAQKLDGGVADLAHVQEAFDRARAFSDR